MPELVCAADDPRWLAERRAGVTATDITAIIGLSPYESEYSLYWKKLGHIPDTREDNDRLRLGRDLEPLIIGRWEESAGVQTGFRNTLWRSPARPWQMATVDALADQDAPGGPKPGGVVEVKSWADADQSAWDDAPPPRVRAQVLWQMDILDVATGHVGVLFLPSGEFRSYVISHADDCVIREITIARETEPGACQVCADQLLMRAAGEKFMARIRHELPPTPPRPRSPR